MTKCAIRTCRAEFVKRSMTHKCCSPECAKTYAEQQRIKAALKEKRKQAADIRQRKELIKNRSQWMKEAQIAFNAYIRNRDKGKPCICCGEPLGTESVGGGFDAGHYRSVGSAPHLRFDERNCHGQRKQCNRYGAGRAVDYRIGLIARIGLAAVEALEFDQEPRKHSIEDLKTIKDHYKAKLKSLKAGGVDGKNYQACCDQ